MLLSEDTLSTVQVRAGSCTVGRNFRLHWVSDPGTLDQQASTLHPELSGFKNFRRNGNSVGPDQTHPGPEVIKRFFYAQLS